MRSPGALDQRTLARRRHPRNLACGGVLVHIVAATSFAAPASSTEIFDTLVIGGPVCTIEINEGDVTACAGSLATFTTTITCGDGYERSPNDPTWLLDDAEIGTGETIGVSIPGAGVYVLTASCGSCVDQITIDAVDCVGQPQLDAAFSNDATEGTAGIFVQKNITRVDALTFARVKVNMRPITLRAEAGLESGTFRLSETISGVVEVFETSGTAVPLPRDFDVATDLPVTLYVNGLDFGRTTLVAENVTPGPGPTDEIVVRVGAFPGISGQPLAEYPMFHYVNTFADVESVYGALDGPRHAARDGFAYDAYVVEHRSMSGWAADNSLTDVSGGAETRTFSSASIDANVVALWTTGLDPGPLVSKSYDIVYDFGRDGTLDPGDILDELDLGNQAGMYVIKDLTLQGPHAVQEATYSGGTFRGQNTFYPDDIASLGQVPLIIMSHGNGHNYQWYDYLGQHYASHGFVFMSHQNNTGPGIETAAVTTLENTRFFLENLATIEGGVLAGHIDLDRIIWSGHSRGGEGVIRAYDKLFDEGYDVGGVYSPSDVVLISGIAPTVFNPATISDPHDKTTHILGAGGDGDVSGAAGCSVCQYFRLADRASGTVQTTYVHGSDHNDFNCCGFNDYSGPPGDEIGRAEAQKIARSYYLALAEWYGKGNSAAKEILTRMYEDIHPGGILSTAIVALSYIERNTPGNYVIDDYESNPGHTQSSSGGAVSFTVTNLDELPLEDTDGTFAWNPADPMNGMTFHFDGGDDTDGVVFDHGPGANLYYELEIPAGDRDLRGYRHVSFRAMQGTQHPETVALDDWHSFSVTLRDGSGVSSTIHFGAWGRLTPLFQRSGGWLNEPSTVRIPLAAYETNGSGIDLGDVEAVRLEFGDAFGSERGRIGMDDVQFMEE